MIEGVIFLVGLVALILFVAFLLWLAMVLVHLFILDPIYVFLSIVLRAKSKGSAIESLWGTIKYSYNISTGRPLNGDYTITWPNGDKLIFDFRKNFIRVRDVNKGCK